VNQGSSQEQRSQHANPSPRRAERPSSTNAQGTPDVVSGPALTKIVDGQASHGLKAGNPRSVAGHEGERNLAVEAWSASIGNTPSVGFTVRTLAENPLEIIIEQLAYKKTYSGTGTVTTQLVPVACTGTTGKLIVRDTVTGETHEQPWTWMSLGEAGTARRLSALVQRFRRKPADPTGQFATKREAACRASFSRAPSTRFFGIAAYGQRIAFILDVSGSMEGPRIARCRQELAAALGRLPANCEFILLLFSDTVREPPTQTGWMPAEKDRITQMIEWMNCAAVGGGTHAWPAFQRAFSFPYKPDTIYFLTDGEVTGLSPPALARLRGSHAGSQFMKLLVNLFSDESPQSFTMIHTIALDVPASEKLLKQIASDSGGEYRMISSDGSA
jgi:hypothetical protein